MNLKFKKLYFTPEDFCSEEFYEMTVVSRGCLGILVLEVGGSGCGSEIETRLLDPKKVELG